MKKVIVLGAMLLVAVSLSAQAQTAKATTGAGKGAAANNSNASTVGSSATNDPAAIGNNRTKGSLSGKRMETGSGSTVDGTNGSATNDGAIGQSGSPAPLPSVSTKPGSTKSSSRKMKRSRKMSNR